MELSCACPKVDKDHGCSDKHCSNRNCPNKDRKITADDCSNAKGFGTCVCGNFFEKLSVGTNSLVLLLLLLLGINFLCAPLSYAQQSKLLTVSIRGVQYQVELFENQKIKSRYFEPSLKQPENVSSAIFYQGALGTADPSGSFKKEGWIRLTESKSEWQGLVFLNGEFFRISRSTPLIHRSNYRGSRVSGHEQAQFDLVGEEFSIDEFSQTYSCSAEQKLTMGRVAELQSAAETESVKGGDLAEVGLYIIELEMFFDSTLVTLAGGESEAAEIAGTSLNFLQGIYQNQLGVAFEQVNIDFLLDDNQSAISEKFPSTILRHVQQQRFEDSLPVKSDISIVQLLTARGFENETGGASNVVGIAPIGQLCNQNAVSLSHFIKDSALTSLVMAHEIAHVIGSEHDGDSNSCETSGYIMGATISSSVINFSSCSKDEVSAFMVNRFGESGECIILDNREIVSASSNSGSGLVSFAFLALLSIMLLIGQSIRSP